MHDYELVVVMNPDIVEEDVPAALERVTTAITTRGGEVLDVQPWGRRRMAYSINRHNEGNYILTHIKLDPLRAHELESGFAISDDILRHLLIRNDEEYVVPPPPPEPVAVAPTEEPTTEAPVAVADDAPVAATDEVITTASDQASGTEPDSPAE